MQGVLKNLKRIPRRLLPTLVVGICGVLLAFAVFLKRPGQGGDDGHGHGGGHDSAEEGEEGHEEHAGESGHVEISDEALELSGIVVKPAKSEAVVTTLRLNGRISFNRERTARIAPRQPGIVKKVFVNIGDLVTKGQDLAIVEANGTLSNYPLKTSLAGTVVARDALPGAFVSDREFAFSVSDLSSVWAEFDVLEADYKALRVGQTIMVKKWDTPEPHSALLNYLSAVVDPDAQTVDARAVIDNQKGHFRPGEFVTADVILDQSPVGVAVEEAAVQIVEGKPVVFVREDETFGARKVELGRRGGGFVEIKSGITADESYAAAGSFVVKAEYQKALAGHDHGH